MSTLPVLTSDDLARPLHAVRRVAPPEAPVAGTRSRLDGEIVLVVDAADLDDWPGWTAGSSAHLLAPRDVIRTPDGHRLVLDDVAEAVEALRRRRLASSAAWGSGELVTLAVALARGAADAHERDLAHAPGTWWITPDGRPLFAWDADGAGSASDEAARTLSAVAQSCDDRVLRRALEELVDALASSRTLGRRLPDLEARLFEAAAPQAIASPPRSGAGEAAARVVPVPDDDGGFWRDAIERHVDARVARLAGDALGAVRERIARVVQGVRERGSERRAQCSSAIDEPPRRSSGRRGAVLVGLAAAAATLALGMLWPTGDSATRAHASAIAPKPAATGEPAAVATASDDPIVAARALLTADACPAGCADPSLVDDFGDAAVVRVDAEDGPRYLLLERREGAWSLRTDTAEGPAD